MGTFIKDKNDTQKTMTNILISLIPLILFAFIKNGIIPYKNNNVGMIGLLYPLILILISSIFGFITETIINIIKEKNIKKATKNNYGIIKGIILALLLPTNTSIISLLLGILLGITITKIINMLFKTNILNQTIISYLLIIVFSKFITSSLGFISQGTLNESLLNNFGTYDTLVRPYGRLFKILMGSIPGTLGSMCSILCILSLAYLTYTKVIKWKIPAIYIITVFAITYVVGGVNDLGIWYPVFQVLTAGLIYKAIFIASDLETSPVTPIGQVLYAIFLGILTVIFRFLIPIGEGILISILIMNLLTPVFDRIGALARFNFKKTIIPFIIAWIMIIGLGLGISMKYNNSENNTPNIEEK